MDSCQYCIARLVQVARVVKELQVLTQSRQLQQLIQINVTCTSVENALHTVHSNSVGRCNGRQFVGHVATRTCCRHPSRHRTASISVSTHRVSADTISTPTVWNASLCAIRFICFRMLIVIPDIYLSHNRGIFVPYLEENRRWNNRIVCFLHL